MSKNNISKILTNLHRYDQKRRREIILEQGTAKLKEARNKKVFLEFKGECEERARITLFIINNFLLDEEDYHMAASIIINVGSLNNLVLAYKLIKKYRELGGKKPWGFYDKYFDNQKWGLTKKEAENIIAKKIGIHPKKLDKIKLESSNKFS